LFHPLLIKNNFKYEYEGKKFNYRGPLKYYLRELQFFFAVVQIYIVASDTSADKDEQGVQSEGLLVLVQPQLPNLSQLWLSALRDHALLLLPSSKLKTNLPNKIEYYIVFI
jgi:hypothetical protein